MGQLKHFVLTGNFLAGMIYPVAAQIQEKPNILLIVTDDQTFESIGCLNNKEVHTPNGSVGGTGNCVYPCF